jgi:hypothetical protein
VLARPIFATQLNTETVFLSAFPGLASGGINVSSSSNLWGMDFNFVGHTGIIEYAEGELTNIQLVAGVRYVQLNEGLQVASTATSQSDDFALFFKGSAFGPGSTTFVNDSFQTRNQFVGPQIGARLDWAIGPWFVNIAVKCAIGDMEETANISGISSLRDAAGNVMVAPGGILAVPSNSGSFNRNTFAFVPEGELTFGVEICDWLKIHVGYNIMYLSDVVRPGDLLNRFVDTRQVPTDFAYNPAVSGGSPIFGFRTTDFWMQGINVGLTFTF